MQNICIECFNWGPPPKPIMGAHRKSQQTVRPTPWPSRSLILRPLVNPGSICSEGKAVFPLTSPELIILAVPIHYHLSVLLAWSYFGAEVPEKSSCHLFFENCHLI